MNILDDLTPSQLEAVTHRDGPMLVIAGAGSGKTRVVTRRIAWLLSQGVWPNQILAMTFTNKAAREMRERIAALTGQIPYNIGTFHGCCARFLRRDITKLNCGRTTDFTIYDTDDQNGVIKRCISEAGEQLPKIVKPSLVSHLISRVKNGGVSWEEACAECDVAFCGDLIIKIAAAYENHLQRSNAVDFDDLLLLVKRLLCEVPAMADIYRSRFRYLLVDEYQDTNHLQYELIMQLANEQHNVHVTGDPDQSIYSWRGADYSNIMSFTRDFPDARVVKLEQNYRSTPTILNAANTIIDNNTNRFPKKLFTENADGMRIVCCSADSDRSEAEWLSRKVKRIAESGSEWNDVAILYRTNSQSRVIEEAFVQSGIPYQLIGGLRFYDRKEIRDFLALLRIRVNPGDSAAWKRVREANPVADGLGPKSWSQLQEEADRAGQPLLEYLAGGDFESAQCSGKSKKSQRLLALCHWCRKLKAIPLQPLTDCVRSIDEAAGFSAALEKCYGEESADQRRENLESFMGRVENFAADEPEADLAAFLQDVALVADVDEHQNNASRVSLMTLHSAKGLEFPFVFIAGVDEGLLPHDRALESYDLNELEEERRLFYVGVTRARKVLYLSRAAFRFNHGSGNYCVPSRFLDEIPGKLIMHVTYHQGREKQI